MTHLEFSYRLIKHRQIQLFHFLGRNAWGRGGNVNLFQKKEVVMTDSISYLLKKGQDI